MKNKYVWFIMALLWSMVAASAQTLARAEYFIDSDPGVGKGTAVSITNDSVLANQKVNVNISALAQGIHILYFRVKDANNKWSITRNQAFLKQLVTLSNLTQAEYFIDTDPGKGKGTKVTNFVNTTDSAETGLIVPVNLSSVAEGIHILYFRAKDASGQWSIVRNQAFLKQTVTLPTLTQAEYFIDTDPGKGKGTQVSIGTSDTNKSMTITANLNALPEGIHILYFRVKDALGRWSIVRNQAFVKQLHNLYKINYAEFFIDTDPGLGKGTSVSITSDTLIRNVAVPVDVTTLVAGKHTVFLRVRDENGAWSIVRHQDFNKVVATLTLSPEVLYLNNTANGKSVSITAANAWTAAVSENWLSLDASSGTSNSVVKVTATANPSKADRYAYVTVTSGGVKHFVIVVQSEAGLVTSLQLPKLKSEPLEVQLYPNPSKGAFTLEWTDKEADFRILSLEGRPIMGAKLITGINYINSQLPTGVYLFEVNGRCRKLVVE